MTTVIRWMDTTEPLPGEESLTQWRVPDDVTLTEHPHGVELQRAHERRFHPWGRVRWIGRVAHEPKRETDPAPPDPVIDESAGIDAAVLDKLAERQGRKRGKR